MMLRLMLDVINDSGLARTAHAECCVSFLPCECDSMLTNPSEVGAGQHTITVQARLDARNICYNSNGAITTCSSADVVNTTLGSSVSAAVFGLGSLTVTPVQLAPGFSF